MEVLAQTNTHYMEVPLSGVPEGTAHRQQTVEQKLEPFSIADESADGHSGDLAANPLDDPDGYLIAQIRKRLQESGDDPATKESERQHALEEEARRIEERVFEPIAAAQRMLDALPWHHRVRHFFRGTRQRLNTQYARYALLHGQILAEIKTEKERESEENA